MIFHSYVSLPEGIAKSYKSSKPTLQPRCSQPNSQWLFRVISPFCGFNLGICQLYMSFFLVLGIYVHRFIGVKLDKHLIVRCLCWFLSTFLLLLRGVSQEREVVKNWWTRPTNSTGWTKTRVKPLTKRDVHPQFWFGDYPIAVCIYIYPVLLPCWWFYGFVWKSRPPKVDGFRDPLQNSDLKRISHLQIFGYRNGLDQQIDHLPFTNHMDWTNKFWIITIWGHPNFCWSNPYVWCLKPFETPKIGPFRPKAQTPCPVLGRQCLVPKHCGLSEIIDHQGWEPKMVEIHQPKQKDGPIDRKVGLQVVEVGLIHE